MDSNEIIRSLEIEIKKHQEIIDNLRGAINALKGNSIKSSMEPYTASTPSVDIEDSWEDRIKNAILIIGRPAKSGEIYEVIKNNIRHKDSKDLNEKVKMNLYKLHKSGLVISSGEARNYVYGVKEWYDKNGKLKK